MYYCDFVCMPLYFFIFCVFVCVWLCVFACVTEQQGPASQVLLRLQAEALQVGLHSHFFSPITQSVLTVLLVFYSLSVCVFACVFIHICVYLPSHTVSN